MVGEALAHIGQPGAPALAGRGSDDPDQGDPAGAADPLEPGGAGEIVGAGQSGGRRRHQPPAQPHRRPRLEPGRSGRGVEIDPEARRQPGALRRLHQQPDQVARRKALEALDPGVELGRPWVAQHRRGGPLRLPPDVGAAEDRGEAEDRRGAAPAGARSERLRRQRQGRGEEQEGDPGRRVRKREPGRSAEAEADREPERKLVALGVGDGFEAAGQSRRPGLDPGSVNTGPGEWIEGVRVHGLRPSPE
jgi:hypothetical protein